MEKKQIPSAEKFVPKTTSLKNLKTAAAKCRGCHLYKSGTQTVFGEGPEKATYVFVGEQPGDQEDLQGRPFVGPAGKLLHRALEEAGFSSSEVYLTNAVKHFKWERSGKHRLHKKPNTIEITACKPWLLTELKAVQPKIIICLGATASKSLLGNDIRITKDRGKPIVGKLSQPVFVTFHPSALLRMPDEKSRHEAFANFVQDLKLAKKFGEKILKT